MFHCGQYCLDLKKRTHIMGILNLTPDSFYKESRSSSLTDALNRVEKIIDEGADIVDVGGESTRPSSEPVPEDEELRRIMPVVKEITKNFNIPISLDTYKSTIAKAALEEGVCIINDISGLRFDPEMAKTVASANAGLVIMHILGKPKTMQEKPAYKNLMKEIKITLEEGVNMAISSGISEERIIIDPGIGFGKEFSHNITILKRLEELKTLKKPLLLGLSRKSFIGKILDLPVEERLEGSLAASIIGILNGAELLRTHDIKETRRAVMVAEAIIKNPLPR